MNERDNFENFTERARKVLILAQEEAQRFQHNYIGTEHLLLGLVSEGEGIVARVLSNLGVELNKVRLAAEFLIGLGPRIVLGESGLTSGAMKAIELAVDEARRLNHHSIDTEHLLLGLVREGEGIAAGILESLGVNLENARTQTIQVLNLTANPPQAEMVVGGEDKHEQFSTSIISGSNQEAAIDQTRHDPATLNDTGMSAFDQYQTNGQLADLNRAVECWREALILSSPDWPDRLICLNNWCIGLHSRYEHTGELADLQAANSILQQAVQATPPNSPDRPLLLNTLSVGLRDRYQRFGNLADLKAASSASQQAVQAAPPDSPHRPALLSNLGVELRDQYERTGDLSDLEAAISAFQQAVQATPPDSPNRSLLLSNLGMGLHDRYQRIGDLSDLEAAISAFQQAVQATPPDSPKRPLLLSNLGVGSRERYLATGDLANLEAAISAFQQAVQATPPDSPNWYMWLSNLGTGLCNRYERLSDLSDLEAAISAFQQAVQATPPDSPNRSLLLSNLGTGLRDRYRATGDIASLARFIVVLREAVRTSQAKSPDRPLVLSNLGDGLHHLYERLGKVADLKAAIRVYQQAVQATPPDSPNFLIRLSNLGAGLYDRYKRTKKLAHLEAAITVWEKEWSIPYPRVVSPVAYQLGQQHRRVTITAALVTAYLEQTKQRFPHSQQVSPRVLELVEGSKSRLLTQLVGRGSLLLPVGLAPQIAVREQQLLAELTILDTQELTVYGHFVSVQKENGHLHRLRERKEILHELERLWASIAHFSREGVSYVALRRGAVPTWQELIDLATALGSATALLSFFATDERALLFLLRAGWSRPHVVEVPLNQRGWADLLERLFHEVHYYIPGQRRRETWEQPLRPLLIKAQQYLVGVERLVLAPESNGHLLPWGVLAEHAGWPISTGQPIPLVTLPALSILPRLQQCLHAQTDTGRVLVIGNPRGDLPYAEAEANEVAKRFGVIPLLGIDATKPGVLSRLPEANLIHFATHAHFDAKDPLESGIELADGGVLTAREILQHRLHADLLVLSACESGKVGSLGGEELAGLSQAFLQAGVRSLLVSLWQVNDTATAALIREFYAAWQSGADKALALRQAMTHIQQDPHWTHPYYWGAFVLMGDWN